MPDVTVLPGQGRLLACRANHTLFVAGVASGKTEGGARWGLLQVIEQPGAVGFIGAQSYAQLARVSLPSFLRLLGEVGLEYAFNRRPPDAWGPSRFPEHERILSIRVPGAAQPAQIITGTMENPDSHRGIAVGWAWLDESRDMRVEAFDVILSRLRGQPIGTAYRTLNTTTPNGFGWLHERFVAAPVPGSAIIRAATTENPYLPAGYVETLRAQYTERFARQEIDGEFLNLTSGQAYHAFRRDDHVRKVVVDPERPLWFSMDFNVAPLCACYGQRTTTGSTVAGEVFIQGSGRTADAAEEFARRFPPATQRNRSVVLYGDMSGAARSTRSDQTDYDVLQRVLTAAGFSVELRRNYHNPALVASVEAVNAHLEHRRTIIDPSARALIKDLEQVAWEERTRVIAKGNVDLTHMSDAYRYFVFREFDLSQRPGWSNALK